MSDAQSSTSTDPAASGPPPVLDELTQFQLAVTHFFGHPRLREVAAALSEEGDHDLRQILRDLGIVLPFNATVGRAGAETDRSGEYSICVGSHYAHCVFFTLPSIHISHF